MTIFHTKVFFSDFFRYKNMFTSISPFATSVGKNSTNKKKMFKKFYLLTVIEVNSMFYIVHIEVC